MARALRSLAAAFGQAKNTDINPLIRLQFEGGGFACDRCAAAGPGGRYLTTRIAERTVFAAPFTVPDISMM